MTWKVQERLNSLIAHPICTTSLGLLSFFHLVLLFQRNTSTSAAQHSPTEGTVLCFETLMAGPLVLGL